MHRLKQTWPNCRLSWLVNTEWAPLLAGNPDIDEVVLFPRHKFRGLGGWWQLARWGREGITRSAPDLALDFQGLLRTALIGRACRAKVLWGLADAREGARWFYHRVAATPAGVPHSVERYLALADLVLGGSAATPRAVSFPLPGGEPFQRSDDELAGNFILLHPFARGSGKSLTSAQIERLCRRLAPRQVVVVGRRGTTPLRLPDGVVDLLDQTSLLELIWVIRRAASVITVDSGPSHLAAALGKPLVAIHTWSDPRRVGPYRGDAWVWKNGRLLTMKEIGEQTESFFLAPTRAPQDADLDAIGDLAISLSGSCA